MFNKSDCHTDRKTKGGKGDLHKHGQKQYQNAKLWGYTSCCNSPIIRFNNLAFCEKCGLQIEDSKN